MVSKNKKSSTPNEPDILATPAENEQAASSMKIVDIVSVEQKAKNSPDSNLSEESLLDSGLKDDADDASANIESQTNEIENVVSDHMKKKLEKSAKKEQKAKNKTPMTSKKLAVCGALVFCFAVIGIISTAIFGVHLIADVINKTSAKATFKEVVTPLVIVDIPAFEGPSMLDSKTVIQVGIWEFLMNEENTEKYDRDEFGTLTVPQSDIEVHIKNVFGSDIEISHQPIPDSEFYIAYDEEQQVYYIPENPQLLPYSANILSIDRNIDIYTVKVGYVSPGPFWDIDQYVDDEPTKTMIYTIKKLGKDNYNVLSVEYTENVRDAVSNNQLASSNIESEVSDIIESEASSDLSSEQTENTEQ